MRGSGRNAFGIILVLVVVSWAIILAPLDCRADVYVAAGGEAHNNRDQVATDLHFTVRLAGWEGEDAGSPYVFTSWDIEVHGVPGGEMTTTERLNPDGNVYAIDVEIDGISVDYCEWVTIYVDATLSAWNALLISNIELTYPEVWLAAPTFGFYFPDELFPGDPHWTSFFLVNEDPEYALEDVNLLFYWDSDWVPIEEWWGMPPGENIHQAYIDYVAPQDSVEVPLYVPSQLGQESYIYAFGSVAYWVGPEPFTAAYGLGHQEQQEPPTPVLESSWDMIKAIYK